MTLCPSRLTEKNNSESQANFTIVVMSVREFMEITGCNEASAAALLAAADGDMEAALEHHYEPVCDYLPDSRASEDLRAEVERDRDLKAAHSAAGPSLLDEMKEQERLLETHAEASQIVQREEGCMVCGRWDEPIGNPMLACDKLMLKRKGSKKRSRCNQLCHLQCCDPPLTAVPNGDWFCVDCAE